MDLKLQAGTRITLLAETYRGTVKRLFSIAEAGFSIRKRELCATGPALGATFVVVFANGIVQ
jgi:hypothetical protein